MMMSPGSPFAIIYRLRLRAAKMSDYGCDLLPMFGGHVYGWKFFEL